jgi:hypothetical protein
MKAHILLAASLLSLPAAWTQSPLRRPVQYVTIACLQRTPGATNAAVDKFHLEFELKRFQHRVNAGLASSWRFERNVLPGGKDADCDYRSITASQEFPERTPAIFADSIRSAGIPLSPEEYVAKRDAVVQLVRLGIYRAEGGVGAPSQKGDFVVAGMAKLKPGQ